MSRSAQIQAHLNAHLQGSPGGTEKLVQSLRPVIMKRVMTVLKRRRTAEHQRSPEILEELIQDVYLHLFRHDSAALRAFDPQGCLSALKYISRIAGRQANNHLNTLWSQKRGGRYGCLNFEPWSEDVLEAPANSYTPESQVAARQAAKRLETIMLPTLSRRGKVAFRAIFFEGSSVEEVALLLGGKTTYVHNWRHRLRREAERVAYQEGFYEPRGRVSQRMAA